MLPVHVAAITFESLNHAMTLATDARNPLGLHEA